MAPLGCRKVLLLSVLLFLFVSVCFSACSEPQSGSKHLSRSRRRLLEEAENEQEFEQPLKKKPTKNQTKPITNLSSKNQTKSIKSNTNLSSKNQTKLAKTTLASNTSPKKLNSTSFKSKKLNSTSKSFTNSSKTSTATNSISSSSKKPLDLAKLAGAIAKNKTTKATATATKNKIKVNPDQSEEEEGAKSNNPNKQITKKKQSPPNWMFEDEDSDLVSEFKDLPINFQKTLIPDLERISTTSKAYITRANKEITKGFKPYVGNKYAPTIATLLSCAFVLIPLLLASLVLNKIKAYFSLQKLLIFIQAYLSIYFSILCLSSFVTGLEPLRFFFSTSLTTYLFLQVIQTLAYVLYLLLLLMYLVLVFSTDSGLGSKLLGLAQTFVGFAVGLHYYMTVFHRVVLRQPPKTNWKVHGMYATCFFVICLFARADRRKKSYLEEGGEDGKKN